METVSTVPPYIHAMNICHPSGQRDLTAHGVDEKAASVGTPNPHAEPAKESPKHTVRSC